MKRSCSAPWQRCPSSTAWRWSPSPAGPGGAVYEAVEKLESGGYAASVPHATDLVPPTRRFHLTADGLERLAGEENATPDELVRDRPVSAAWRRILMERLDALAVIYRLAAAVSGVAYPLRFRWFRASPLDASMTLPDGRTVGVVRRGLTADRSAFSNRMRRLRDGPLPGTVLVLMPDEVGLRHARRMLTGAPVPCFLALEREAVAATPGDPVWSPPAVHAAIDLRSLLDRAEPGGPLPAEPEPSQASAPADLAVEGPGWNVPDHMLPCFLKPAEKRALDLLSDWPWIVLKDLAGLLGVSAPRASQLVNPLEGFGLATRAPGAGGRLTLTDRGLAVLARRDRTSVAVARKRWSVAPLVPKDPFDWRNVSGGRSRQLLRNVEHTAAVHGFVAALARQAGFLGWEIAQLDPPRRASRYFRHEGGMRSIHPDAFGVLRKGGDRLGLLPGVGAPRRAALDHVGPPRALSALLLIAQAHRRPRHKARRPGRLRRRDRPDPLPARGAGGDAGGTGHGAPVDLPQGGHRRPGAAGRRMAHARRVGVAKDTAAPCEPGQTGGSVSYSPAPVSTEYRRTKNHAFARTPTK